MAGFSLTEKLAVAGAFLALVALGVGTEDDPGMVVTGQDEIKALKRSSPQPEMVPPRPATVPRDIPQVLPPDAAVSAPPEAAAQEIGPDALPPDAPQLRSLPAVAATHEPT